MLDVVDGIRELLEDGSDATVSTDDSGERPYDWTPWTLYVWEESSAHTSIGTGEVREDFVVVAAIAVPNDGEESVGVRSRAVTERLDAKRNQYLDAIRRHTDVGPWRDGYLAGASVPDYLRQLDLRGIAVRVTGWRIID